MRIAVNIVVLVALGALLVAATSCSEEPTQTPIPTATATPTATPPPIATSVPSPTATMNPDDTVTSADPQPDPEPTRTVPADMIKTLAVIESVSIRVAESYPPQYFVDVAVGLPNACVEFYGYEEDRDGTTITVTVYNLEPSPSSQVACAEVYTTHEFVVALGTDFQSGETYTLNVNQTVTTFVAQ